MNILLINHYAGSPSLGMEYRPYYMAREWQKSGNKVMIVAASNAHVRSTQFKLNNDFEKHNVEGINYLIIKTPSYEGNGVRRIFNMVGFVRKLNKYSHKISNEFKPDVVIASSTYPLDIYPAKKIATLSGAKLVFEVHDLWPLAPIELGGYSKWHPFILVIQHAENYAYKHASTVVSIWPKALEHMVKHGMKPEKFVYIPNGIVTEEWDTTKDLPDDLSSLIQKLKDQKKLLLGYAGSHGLANALYSLIDAMKILERENIALIMIGNGPEKENLIQKSKDLNLANTYFYPSINKNLIPSALDKLDILFIGLKHQPLFRFGICPNKMVDYMMASKPIIQSYSAGVNLVTEANCGIAITPENPNAIADAVRHLIAQSKESLIKMGSNGKTYCMAKHDYKIIANNFLQVLS
ncbi:MAG: glycosyltransferase family 4 protein [Ignavibacteriales bacterium]|nr:glycosyltransferase family 4 protein [Ignavibacteriales bacterium]